MGAVMARENGTRAVRPVVRSRAQADQLVLDVLRDHAESLLRVARRHSLCADDAQDAYQRSLEILMRHARRLDAERAGGWLHTVVKREAMALNKSRRRMVGGDEVDLDTIEVRTAPSPEDQVLAFERVSRSAEALQRLKPQEIRALQLRAEGYSYAEICELTGWTYTKVNRCLAEGRARLRAATG
jgi:RNA polymerase sigma factor (sigma-70 family)